MPVSESAAAAFYHSLTPRQRKVLCFDPDYRHPVLGLLRSHVSNVWYITEPVISGPFFSRYQRALLFDVFRGLFHPDWHTRLLRQLRDDHHGLPWGGGLTCAVFGEPDTGPFQLVMTGRHLTVRTAGDSQQALGGPIFHGHAPSGYREKPGHPGNVFWHQARLANAVHTLLDGKQRQQALLSPRPPEHAVAFRGPDAPLPGLPCAAMSRDQKDAVRVVLHSLIEPYRSEDQQRVLACLDQQGGLERCSLAFYPSGDHGEASEWENWRLEGPAFVWYFRGYPHVHIWVHVAGDPSVPLNSRIF
jgi:hypothetical protein